MKSTDMQKLSQHAAVLERVAMFGVSEIQSITVQANMHGSSPDARQRLNIGIRIDPSDPRFATLKQILDEEAAKQKTAAEAALSDMNMAVEPDPDLIEAVRQDSVAGKALFEDQVERNRIKKITADALAAEAAKGTNGKTPPAVE
jgi:hypothetical protein